MLYDWVGINLFKNNPLPSPPLKAISALRRDHNNVLGRFFSFASPWSLFDLFDHLTKFNHFSLITLPVCQDELVTELGPEGVFRDVTYSLDTLGTYVNDTMDEIEEVVIMGTSEAIGDAVQELETIPDYTM